MRNYEKRINLLKMEIEDLKTTIQKAKNCNRSGYAKRLEKMLILKEEKLDKWISFSL
jgi:hypothetical protein